MNENELNQTEWHDGQGNAVEQNDPAALAENADGKWHRVKGVTVTETTINGKKVITGMNYRNGYAMNMSASAKVTKGETAAVWIGSLAGILIGILAGIKKGFIPGVYFAICIPSCTMVAVGVKALMREDPEKNKKIAVFMSCFIIGVLFFIGIVILITSHA